MALDRQDILKRLEGDEGSRDLSGLDLSGAELSRLDLRGVNLSRADLSAADLRWALLEGADLDAAVLRRADARWAVLRGANLRQADLVRTNMGWSDLTGADLTGADIDGANLENAEVEGTILDPGMRRRRPAVGTAAPARRLPGSGAMVRGVSLPEVSPLTVFAAIVGVVALIWLWGWAFNRAYFVDAFGLDAPGIVVLTDYPNLLTGLSQVAWLEIKTLLVIPLIFVALVLVVALIALIPLLLTYLSERVLSDIVRREVRPFVIGGLFVAMTIFFLFAIPRALAFAGNTTGGGAPSDAGLSAVFELFRIGGWLYRIGLVVCLALAAYVLWIVWRLFCRWLVGAEVPTNLRLRYPHLNAAFVSLRESRLTDFSAPLSGDERRRGLLAAAGLVLLLGTVLTGTGKVYAYRDMCDGGDLPRGQLFRNYVPNAVDDRLLCERMVADNGTSYFVFFPSQTSEAVPGDISSRAANVQSVEQGETLKWQPAVGNNDCPTCVSSLEHKSDYRTRIVVDPDEVEAQGLVLDRTADLVMLDVENGGIGSVRLLPDTVIVRAGAPGSTEDIVPGVFILAVGRLALDAPILEARLVEVLEQSEPPTQATITVELQDPYTIVISGTDWTPGNAVDIGIAVKGAAGPQYPLADDVIVGQDGTFSVPVRYDPNMPTGPQYVTMAVDTVTGATAVGPWLEQAPPPTATPPPTPTPIQIVESTATPAPGEPEEGTGTPGTPTPATASTNTPFPTAAVGLPGVGDCTPDEFEPDWPRGFEKEIFVGFGEANTQQHSFCGRGLRYPNDIDLSYFQVKAGRSYRVTTSDLAPGVDTVIAVGDLGNDTPCSPAGCWNDDKAALTYDSEVEFQAVRDARAMITVDNRGSAYGTDATYKLSVVEFEPEPTATPTLAASPTTTGTPTTTPTPLPLVDRYEVGNRCRESETWRYLELNRDYDATISSRTDEDWYETVTLEPGVKYVLEMWPPHDQDYDLELWTIDSRTTCSLVTTVQQGRNPGEGVPERIPPLPWYLEVTERTSYAVRVFSTYPNIYHTPHAYYRLRLSTAGGAPEPTATATATITPTPPASPTPTFTPTVPTPEGGLNPPTGTAPPPTLTPTDTPVPVPTTVSGPAEGRGR